MISKMNTLQIISKYNLLIICKGQFLSPFFVNTLQRHADYIIKKIAMGFYSLLQCIVSEANLDISTCSPLSCILYPISFSKLLE